MNPEENNDFGKLIAMPFGAYRSSVNNPIEIDYEISKEAYV